MSQKTVLLGVTGCIAAYKSAELVRSLQKAGYRVKVVMTQHATEFITPTTFRALTHEPVAVDLFVGATDPIYHISLAQEADLFLIAPATANVIAKIAHGMADDLLTTTALACTAPIVVCPAMNTHMYENAATQSNMELLRRRGFHVMQAATGYLACGDTGQGRLPELSAITDYVSNVLTPSQSLAGKKVLITAGPTHEAIDPVRFISNPSSGKMGFALAGYAADEGAEVTLVTGPVSLPDIPGIHMVRVTTALEMMTACENVFPQMDIAVFSAAVSDMRPENPADQKLKKPQDSDALTHITLVENPDILRTCAQKKNSHQIVVGFAAETENVLMNAREKLVSKQADALVANDVSAGKGFGSDEENAYFVTRDQIIELGYGSKCTLASKIFNQIKLLEAQSD